MIKMQIVVPKGYGWYLDKAGLKKVMRGAATEIAGKARSLIRQKAGRGKKRTSVAGGAPVSQSALLARSIRIRSFSNGMGFTIRDDATSPSPSGKDSFYARFLEVGARGGGNPGRNSTLRINPKTGKRVRAKGVYTKRVLEPHPFISTAFEQSRASLSQRIVDAITKGVEFKKLKT